MRVSKAAVKPPLLFLAHRVPYPPNKGDKIRSFHLLKYLSEHFSIYLGTFVDDDDDWQYCAAVRAYCVDTCFVERKPVRHKAMAASALLLGGSISVRFYASRQMQRWVDDCVVTNAIDRALVFCAPVAQFVAPETPAGKFLKKIVVDFVDVDSEKWRQYAIDHTSPVMRLVYRQEAESLLAYERQVSGMSDISFFVSAAEASLFCEVSPECKTKVSYFLNGVDKRYFRPDPALSNSYTADSKVLVFTGAMDYWPNVDAVTWFADHVFPVLLAGHPELQFWIVGGKPSTEVTALAKRSGIFVTGRVPDVRPYLQHAFAAVAPMRIARGIQNKVLEAMAMGLPVMASTFGLEGILAESESLEPALWRLDTTEQYVASLDLLFRQSEDKAGIAQTSVGFISKRFDWRTNLQPVVSKLL